MLYCNIIINKDNVIEKNAIFIGKESADVMREAEREFIRIAIGWDSTLSEEDVNNLLDEGYFEYEGKCVCINWPEEVNV